MSEPVPPHDGILAQILLKQGEMGTQLAVIASKLDSIPDHETRIRNLERWKYSLPLTAVSSLGAVALAIAAFFHR